MVSWVKQLKRNGDIKPRTPFERNYYVGFTFRKAYRNCIDQRILTNRLRYLATIKIDGMKSSYEYRRSKKYPCHKKCYICKKLFKAKFFHHIILLKNGGSNIVMNRLPLCPKCHKKIHDWL